MDILVPKNVFLRVDDKSVPHFIDNDKAVRSSAALLYRKLFSLCAKTGKCTLPQKELAAKNIAVRTVQYAQKKLEALEFIHIEHTPGACNTYVLLLSSRVKQLLASVDLIDRSGWYERPEKPAQPAMPSPLEAAEARIAELERKLRVLEEGAAPLHDDQPAHAIPPQKAQDGYASSAHSSYKEDKKYKNISPLSPLPETPAMPKAVTPPDAHHGRGDSFPVSSKNYAAMLQAFEQLWAIWPVKQDRHRSLRVFCSLARSGRLPSLAALLAAIQNMSANDDRWRRGYPPNLVNWLQGRRWNDEPIRRSSAHAEPAAPSARPDAKKEHKVLPLPASAPLPELSPAMESTVQNLCSIWPAPSHTPVRAFFRALLARKNTLDTSALLAAARAHLAEAGAASGSLLRWLMSHQWDEQRNCAA